MSALWVHDGVTVRPLSRSWWDASPSPDLVGATAVNTGLVPGAGAHSLGAWVELIAATTGPADRAVALPVAAGVSAATPFLLDLGIGPAGGEEVILSGVAVGSWNRLWSDLPLSVPAGSRVSARVQTGNPGRTMSLQLALYGSGRPGPSALDVLGTSRATSRGVSVSTAGAWVEVTPATTRPYAALIAVPSAATNNLAAADCRLAVAVGAAGAEVQMGSVRVVRTTGEQVNAGLIAAGLPENSMLVPGHVPEGERLSVMDSAGGLGADACLIGVVA